MKRTMKLAMVLLCLTFPSLFGIEENKDLDFHAIMGSGTNLNLQMTWFDDTDALSMGSGGSSVTTASKNLTPEFSTASNTLLTWKLTGDYSNPITLSFKVTPLYYTAGNKDYVLAETMKISGSKTLISGVEVPTSGSLSDTYPIAATSLTFSASSGKNTVSTQSWSNTYTMKPTGYAKYWVRSGTIELVFSKTNAASETYTGTIAVTVSAT
jgi:hypothetical protein